MLTTHETRTANGHDYNRETADCRLVGRRLIVPGCGTDYVLDLEFPGYIADKLKTHDWDLIERSLTAYAARMTAEADLVGASRGMIQHLLMLACRRAIYDRFTAAQIRAGNESWAVPFTLHKDQYPRVRQ